MISWLIISILVVWIATLYHDIYKQVDLVDQMYAEQIHLVQRCMNLTSELGHLKSRIKQPKPLNLKQIEGLTNEA